MVEYVRSASYTGRLRCISIFFFFNLMYLDSPLQPNSVSHLIASNLRFVLNLIELLNVTTLRVRVNVELGCGAEGAIKADPSADS